MKTILLSLVCAGTQIAAAFATDASGVIGDVTPADTRVESPGETLMHRVDAYTELAELLTGVDDQARADAAAPRAAELAKLTMVFDRQWGDMESRLSGDERRSLHNAYENQMNDSRNKARNEAQRIRDKGYFGSVPMRKALVGFLPEGY